MSSTPESFQIPLLNDGLAANDDQIGEPPALTVVVKAASGWDPYEVWKRRIKEPRDRRMTARTDN